MANGAAGDPQRELDPQSRAFLESMRETRASGFAAAPLEVARSGLKELMLSVDVPRTDVAGIEDVELSGGDRPLRVRIYRPVPDTGIPGSVLLFCHGGGWALGDLDCYDNMCRSLCSQGCITVVSVDYRRTPEHRFPAALEDCYAALRWISVNGALLTGSQAVITVCGDSAGANLAAVLALQARSRAPAVARQVLLYPLLSLLADAPYPSRRQFGDGGYFISAASIAWSVGLYLDDPAQADTPRASPILEPDLSGAPAALIITAGFDPLRDEGELYGRRLMQAGVPVSQLRYPGTIHGFMSFAGAIQAGRDALQFVAGWLRGPCR